MEIPIQLTLDLQTTESKETAASIDYEDFPEDAANELARLESFNTSTIISDRFASHPSDSSTE
jgi:hypothetical protein